jgi:hypothetical protein
VAWPENAQDRSVSWGADEPSSSGDVRSERFDPELASVPAARGFVVSVLDGWAQDEARFIARLLTSELSTNAVQHGRTEFVVTVGVVGTTATVRVFDHNPRMPQPCLVPPDAVSGKGLQLVDSLASSWGCDRHPNGKVVWFAVHQGAAMRSGVG